MRTIILATILLASQWSLAQASFTMTSYMATAPDFFCKSFHRQLSTVKDTEETLIKLHEIYKEAVEANDEDDISQYEHLIDEYTDLLAMHQEDLDRMALMEVAVFKGTLSDDVTVPTSEVNNRLGRWEISNSWQTTDELTAILGGGLHVRILGGLACNAWEDSGENLKRSIELSFQELITR